MKKRYVLVLILLVLIGFLSFGITIKALENDSSNVTYSVTYKYSKNIRPPGVPPEPETKSYLAGTLVEVEPVPVLPGFKFYGWNRTGSFIINEDIVIEGYWNAINYYHKYNGNGEKRADGSDSYQIKVLYGSSYDTQKNIFTRPGYRFLGWSKTPNGEVDYLGGQFIINNLSTVENDVVNFYAVWEVIPNGSTYKIKYFLQDLDKSGYTLQEDLTEERIGTAEAEVSITPKNIDGMIFDENNDLNKKRMVLTGNPEDALELYYKRDKFKVYFNGNGGFFEGNDTYVVEKYYGEKIELDIIPFKKDHYELVQWENEDNYYDLDDQLIMDTEDIKLDAVWGPKKYKIEYDYDGGKISNEKQNPSEYTIESEDIIINNPTKVGYKFVGWIGSNIDFPNEELVIKKGSFGDCYYKAIWEIIDYKVIFDANGGVFKNNDSKLIYDNWNYTKSDDVEIPIRDGYKFVGWYTSVNDGIKISDEPLIEDNFTFYAVWEKIDEIPKTLDNVMGNIFMMIISFVGIIYLRRYKVRA